MFITREKRERIVVLLVSLTKTPIRKYGAGRWFNFLWVSTVRPIFLFRYISRMNPHLEANQRC